MTDRSWTRPMHNLPRQLTSFVGRGREVDEVAVLLSTARLVTLVGAGGVGKTRLAFEVANRHVDNRADHVRLVELAALRDPMLVPHVVAAAFDLHELAGRSVS